ncbi:ABC transporter permease [Caldicellulosiruptoraceae bacterium PP1]
MKKLLEGAIRPILAIIIAVLVGGIVIVATTGQNPFYAYYSLLVGAFGSSMNIATTLTNAIPLIITGLGIAIAFSAGLFNIGAEGQYWIGAIVATYIGYSVKGLPGYLHIPLIIVLAMLAGALWGGLVPGLAKVYTGAHEVITTMMMSYVAIYLSHFLLEDGPMMDKGVIPQSPIINESAKLSRLIENSQLSSGLFIAIIAVIIVYILMYKTTLGFEMRSVGFNQRASKYAGMNVATKLVTSLGLSGAFAALAGAVQIMGVQHRLYDSFTSGYGYTAIVVALLANNNPIGVVIASIFLAGLSTGAQEMQMRTNISGQLTDVVVGLIIFFIAIEELYKIVIDRIQKKKQKMA